MRIGTIQKVLVSLLAFGLVPTLQAQGLVINEVVSSNRGSALDEDGETPDWIELYNTSNSSIPLDGLFLSDNANDLEKWTFQGGHIAPGAHKLIFASDNDRQSLDLFWSPLITEGDIWRYHPGDNEPPVTWKSLTFNDGSWQTGPTGIGYSDGDDATIIDPTVSLYMRKTFVIANPAEVLSLIFHMDIDDGYVAYLNGIEISRYNLQAPGTFISHTTSADTWTEPRLPQGLDLEGVMADPALLVPGLNVLAIQVHNAGLNSSDLSALPFLSWGGAVDQGHTLPEFLIIRGNPYFHTNFKLSSSGETLYLTHPESVILDSLAIPPLDSDVSYGRATDGAVDYLYFNPSTPGSPNQGGFPELASPVLTNFPPGFYSTPIPLELSSDIPGTEIRYTVSGNIPDDNSPLYLSPLILNGTTIVRVRTSSPDGLHHHFSAFSYFIGEDHDLPVVSLIFEPGDFFDNDYGIYVLGDNASGDFPYFGANFWEDWERPIHIEYFENADDLSFSGPGGVKIFGGWSRGQAQRSLALYARGSYGLRAFDYPFFPERDYDSFQALVLRNAGNDWNYSGYRDVFMNSLVEERDLERQEFVTTEVYLNGEYWGVYNLREKINEHMIASQADLDTDEFDMLEINGTAIHGSSDQYWDLVNFVETTSLVPDVNFEHIRETVDLENFIEYQFAQIYFDNRDWPGNNIKYWKAHTPGGKWRWILYDTDFGFGIWNPSAYWDNTLAFALDPNGPGWPNPPWSTLFLRKFITNESFQTEFILRASDMLNRDFKPEVVTEKLTARRDMMSLGIIDHLARWQHTSITSWNNQYSNMMNFAELRPAYVRTHIRNTFNLPQAVEVTVNVQPPGAGLVKVHSVTPESFPWTGEYFPGVPLDIQAIPAAGYSFSQWSGMPSSNPDLLVDLSAPTSFTAIFSENPVSDQGLVINEINYHSSDMADAKDWLELVNFGSETVDLNGWIIQDGNDDNQFVLPPSVLEPFEWLVIVSDSTAFRAVHGPEVRITGELGFNFNNGGELIRLLDPLGTLVDSVHYTDQSPWPVEADGAGPTLELIHPTYDNGDPGNWAASDDWGSPGRQNSRYADPSSVTSRNIPGVFALGPAYPNPFNDQVSMQVHLDRPGDSEIQVFDIRGRMVHELSLSHLTAGTVKFQWDARGLDGSPLSSGVYLIRVSMGDHALTSRIALIR